MKYTQRKNGKTMTDVLVRVPFTKNNLYRMGLIAKCFGYTNVANMLLNKVFDFVIESIEEDFNDMVENEIFCLDNGLIKDRKSYFKAKELTNINENSNAKRLEKYGFYSADNSESKIYHFTVENYKTSFIGKIHKKYRRASSYKVSYEFYGKVYLFRFKINIKKCNIIVVNLESNNELAGTFNQKSKMYTFNDDDKFSHRVAVIAFGRYFYDLLKKIGQ